MNDTTRFCQAALWLLLFYLSMLFSGCASLTPAVDPGLTEKAEAMARNAKNINRDILSSKGTGRVRIITETDTQAYKFAWAAAFPNKIRITFMVSGLPVETVVATGSRVSFISHTGSHKPYTTQAKDPDMNEMIKVPVRLSELVALLLGRLPLKPYDAAAFSSGDPSMKTIRLRKYWSGTRQTLFLDRDNQPAGLDTTGPEGGLLYDLDIISVKNVDSHAIPSRIEMSDGGQRRISLTLLHIQVNPDIKESVFRLTAKGS